MEVIEILSHDVRKGGKERNPAAQKKAEARQERDRIVPERGHLSGKGFCGSGTREFIGSATRANVSYFKVKLEM